MLFRVVPKWLGIYSEISKHNAAHIRGFQQMTLHNEGSLFINSEKDLAQHI